MTQYMNHSMLTRSIITAIKQKTFLLRFNVNGTFLFFHFLIVYVVPVFFSDILYQQLYECCNHDIDS